MQLKTDSTLQELLDVLIGPEKAKQLSNVLVVDEELGRESGARSPVP